MSAHILTWIMACVVILGSLRRVPPALAEFLHSCHEVVREWQAMRALLERAQDRDHKNDAE